VIQPVSEILPQIGSQIACTYRNSTDRMVILRCCGPEQFFLERVVFPFELLSFGCPADAEVTIWSHGLGGAELVEAMQAEQLLSDDPHDTEAASGAPTPALVAG
jgi:hypothetical protein